MKVRLKYQGCSPNSSTPYAYHILTENGHADVIYENIYTSEEEIEMVDELFTEGSGWLDAICSVCGSNYRERCRSGMVIACPVCGEPRLVTDNDVLEDSNLMEDDYEQES